MQKPFWEQAFRKNSLFSGFVFHWCCSRLKLSVQEGHGKVHRITADGSVLYFRPLTEGREPVFPAPYQRGKALLTHPIQRLIQGSSHTNYL